MHDDKKKNMLQTYCSQLEKNNQRARQMIRLKNSDICDIPFQLKDNDYKLKKITGKSLLGVAYPAWDLALNDY